MSCLGGSGPGAHPRALSSATSCARLGRGQPARRLEALQFLGHFFECDGGGARLRPQNVAVNVIGVVVRIEHVLHGLGRDALNVGHGGARAAGIVGVDHDQVVLHLDDDVVAVPLVPCRLPGTRRRGPRCGRFRAWRRSAKRTARCRPGRRTTAATGRGSLHGRPPLLSLLPRPAEVGMVKLSSETWRLTGHGQLLSDVRGSECDPYRAVARQLWCSV